MLSKVLVSLALISITSASVTFADPYIGAEWNPTGNPIGGGPGYSDSICHQDADYIVYNKTQLQNAISNALDGEIIYIDDNAEIDLTGERLLLNKRITLASGRGRTLSDTISWGGLIYCTDHERSIGLAGELILANAKNIRITGLRLRGGFSQLEGHQVETDTFAQPLPVCYFAIYAIKDSVEIDNCEIWGFSGAAIAIDNFSAYWHHNVLQRNEHCYHAYGVSYWDRTTIREEANFYDYHQWLVMSGGDNGQKTRGIHSWNIYGHHTFGGSFECHVSGNDSCSWDSIVNCSFYTTGFTYGRRSGYKLEYPTREPTYVQNCWFKNDSAKSIYIAPNALCNLSNNQYSTTPPGEAVSRIPIPSISCTVDSGTAPLTVTFSASASFDPDGEIIAFYWSFGDSMKQDNYSRYTDIGKTVSHTYNRIGRYLVELMVVDNHGIVNYVYRTISVVPNDNKYWLSCWIKDRNYDRVTGYYKKQILIDNWVCWEKDVAGNGSWEQVILDLTDSLSGKDSVNLTFRLLCVRDTSRFWQPMMYVDDVVLYGANVINGDFESGTWTGNVYTRTDGHWQGSEYDGGQWIYVLDFEMDVHSGKRAFYLGTMENPHYSGDWGKVEQRVDVTGLGVERPPENRSGQVCSLYFPYPNPSQSGFAMSYRLAARSMVSMKIYDASGRFIRTLVDEEEEEVGEYQVHWDGKDEIDRPLANGVYFCRFCAGDLNETRKLVIFK